MKQNIKKIINKNLDPLSQKIDNIKDSINLVNTNNLDEFETTFTDYDVVKIEKNKGIYRFIIKVEISQTNTFNIKSSSENEARKKAIKIATEKWKSDSKTTIIYTNNEHIKY